MSNNHSGVRTEGGRFAPPRANVRSPQGPPVRRGTASAVLPEGVSPEGMPAHDSARMRPSLWRWAAVLVAPFLFGEYRRLLRTPGASGASQRPERRMPCGTHSRRDGPADPGDPALIAGIRGSGPLRL